MNVCQTVLLNDKKGIHFLQCQLLALYIYRGQKVRKVNAIKQ